MPNLSAYKRILNGGKTAGQIRKSQSDLIMEQTWWEDIQSRVCYLYDYAHDDEPDKNYYLNPEQSTKKIPIDAKYIVNSYNSDNKDQVSYRLQFRPSQECNVDYYEESFVKKVGAEFPIGLYVDIPDAKGIYRRWLIHDKGNSFDSQFVTYSILPCDYNFKWVFDGKIYHMWGVSRSQSSYNSGVWADYKVETIENQRKCRLPFNDITANLYYNQRMIISAPIPEPITWRVTKIENTAPLGINLITFAQDKFDQHKDNAEMMLADYYLSSIEPTEPEVEEDIVPDNIYAAISYSGIKPEIKVGASKTLTVKYFNVNGEEVEHEPGDWKFEVDGDDISSDVDIEITGNEAIIKINSYDYLGEIITITNSYIDMYNILNNVETTFELEIVGM